MIPDTRWLLVVTPLWNPLPMNVGQSHTRLTRRKGKHKEMPLPWGVAQDCDFCPAGRLSPPWLIHLHKVSCHAGQACVAWLREGSPAKSQRGATALTLPGPRTWTLPTNTWAWKWTLLELSLEMATSLADTSMCDNCAQTLKGPVKPCPGSRPTETVW